MYDNPEQLFGGQTTMLSLIGMMYEAVDDPALWPQVIDRFAELVESGCTVMLTNYGNERVRDISAIARVDEGFIGDYVAHYSAVNVWTDPCNRMFREGTVSYSHQAVPDNQFEKSEWYGDFLGPNDYYYGFGMRIPMPGLDTVTVTSLRPKRNGPYGEREGGILTTLMPHFQRALGLHLRLSQIGSSIAGLKAAFDAFDQAVFGLATGGKVLFMNGGAEELARRGRPLYLQENFLRLRLRPEDRELQRLLKKVSDRGAEAVSGGGGAILAHSGGMQPLRIVALPFLGGAGGTGATLAAIVFVNSPLQHSAGRADLLRILYQLSPTETRLVGLFAEGLEVAAISTRMQVSTDAVRFHLKNIFQKTGVNRQIELLRLLLSLPG